MKNIPPALRIGISVYIYICMGGSRYASHYTVLCGLVLLFKVGLHTVHLAPPACS